MTKNELITERAKLWEQAKNFVDSHEDKATGKLSAEDTATFEKMENDIDAYTSAINRAERIEKRDHEMSMPVNEPLVSKPVDIINPEATMPLIERDEYRKACVQAVRTKFQRVSDVMEEGTDANGGYLVPDEWDKKIVKKLEEENIMRQVGDKIKTSGDHNINIEDTSPTADWIDEKGALSFSDQTYSQITLSAWKLHVAIKVTEELLYDNAYNLETALIEKMGKVLGNAEEDAFLNGNGNKKPTGIFDTTAGGSLAVDLTSKSQFTADTILDLIYTLKKPYRKNAKFIMNDKTVALIRKFKDQNGQYLWQPSYQAGEPDRLAGYPLLTSAYAPEIAATASETDDLPFIAFGDYSFYKIGDRGARSFAILRELFAANGMIGYVLKQRVDGKLTLPEAVQLMYIKKSE